MAAAHWPHLPGWPYLVLLVLLPPLPYPAAMAPPVSRPLSIGSPSAEAHASQAPGQYVKWEACVAAPSTSTHPGSGPGGDLGGDPRRVLRH